MEIDKELEAELEKVQPLFLGIQEEASRVIVGQKNLLHKVLVGLISGGHILLEGLPGLAKTLTVQTISDLFDLHFKRM